MDNQPRIGAGAVVIAPSWATSGSFVVFQGQLRTLTELGFDTYFLACPSGYYRKTSYPAYIAEYRWLTEGLGAMHRGELVLPRFLLLKEAIENLRSIRTTEAYRATISARIMEMPESLNRFVRDRKELFVLCNHYFNVPLVRKLNALVGQPLRFVLATHDVQARHYIRRSHLAANVPLSERILADELAFASQADALIHISDDEYPFFAKAIPNRPHYRVFPALRQRDTKPVAASEMTFLIVASLNEENAEGVDWFLQNVWARYDGQGTLKIVGQVADIIQMKYPETFGRWRQHFVGRVKDIENYYWKATVVIIPVIAGEGIAIKFAEAMSFGKRMLFTPCAARGLPKAAVDAVASGLCVDADTMLKKMLAIPQHAPIEVDQASLRCYLTLFSQEQHIAAFRHLTLQFTNQIRSRQG